MKIKIKSAVKLPSSFLEQLSEHHHSSVRVLDKPRPHMLVTTCLENASLLLAYKVDTDSTGEFIIPAKIWNLTIHDLIDKLSCDIDIDAASSDGVGELRVGDYTYSNRLGLLLYTKELTINNQDISTPLEPLGTLYWKYLEGRNSEESYVQVILKSGYFWLCVVDKFTIKFIKFPVQDAPIDFSLIFSSKLLPALSFINPSSLIFDKEYNYLRLKSRVGGLTVRDLLIENKSIDPIIENYPEEFFVKVNTNDVTAAVSSMLSVANSTSDLSVSIGDSIMFSMTCGLSINVSSYVATIERSDSSPHTFSVDFYSIYNILKDWPTKTVKFSKATNGNLIISGVQEDNTLDGLGSSVQINSIVKTSS